MSLRTVITLPFAFLLALISLLTTLLFLRTNVRATTELTEEIRNQVTSRIESYVRDFVEDAVEVNAQNAALLRQGVLSLSREDQLHAHLWAQLRHNPTLAFVFVGTPRGGTVGAGRAESGDLTLDSTRTLPEYGPIAGRRTVWRADDSGTKLDQVSSAEGFDARQRPWFRAAVETERPTWSPPYVLFAEQALAVAASAPVTAPGTGELLAVVGADLSLATLGKYLRQFDLPGNGRILLVERDGRLVATSDPRRSELRNSTDDAWSRRLAAQSEDPLISAAARAVINGGGFASISELQQFLAEVEDGTVLIDVAPLRGPPELDWLVVSAIPRAAFTAAIARELRWTAAFSLFALLLALFLGAVLSKRISNTVGRLGQVARSLAERREVAPVPATRIRELDELGRVFQEMSARVEGSMAELEARVAERTHEFEEARTRADQANQAKSEFLSRVSHELRTPLASICGYLELFSSRIEGHSKEGELLEALETVAASSAQLQALVDDLLDFQRLQSGQLPTARSSFTLERLLRGLMRAVAPQAEAKGLQLQLEYQLPSGLRITTDRRRLEQILGNLVSNGIKYTRRGSVVLTARRLVDAEPPEATGAGERATAHPHDLIISVRDTGVGIPEERMQDLFEPFSRMEQQSVVGFGLGLAIARELSEALGFELSAKSSVGHGSEFTLRLPQALDPEFSTVPLSGHSTTAPQPLFASGPLPSRLLIADDSDELRRLIQLQLEAWNIESDTASDGEEALDLLRQGAERYDAALLDWHMPGLTGLEVAQRARDLQLRIPLAAITASAFEQQRQACLDSGFDEVLTKPIDFARLHAWLVAIAQGDERADALSTEAEETGHEAVEISGAIARLKRQMGRDLPQQIRELASLAHNDPDAFRGQLHRMTGTIGTYGFHEVQAALEDLEQCARGELDPSVAWAALEQAAERARSESG